MITAEYNQVSFCEHCNLELSAESLKCQNCETMVDLNPLDIEIKPMATEEVFISESEYEAESSEENDILANGSKEVSPKRKVQATQPLVSGDTADAAEVILDKYGKSSKYTTPEQFDVLIEEMRSRPDMANGVSALGSNRQQWEKHWELIREKLNSRGPPIRNIPEWKKVWTDLKSRTKKKLTENASEVRKRGSACLNLLAPTELEVDKILSLSASILAYGAVHSDLDTQKRPQEDIRVEQASTSAASASPVSPVPKRRKTDDDEFLLLLRQQTETQHEVLNKLDKISDSIERIAKALELLVSRQAALRPQKNHTKHVR